jgi:hypothetical protein
MLPKGSQLDEIPYLDISGAIESSSLSALML